MNPQSRLRVEADLGNIGRVCQFVEERTTGLGAGPDAVHDLVLAVNEAAANIIIHGYRGQAGTIEIQVGRDDAAIVVCVRDQAPAFDPNLAPAPDLSLPLEERLPGGLGIHLMRQLVDEVSHRVPAQGGNELVLIKELEMN